MDSLRAMRLFVRVVELGSFSAAAREATLTQPTLSKMVTMLERELGVRLLERTTTSLNATEEGRRFYERSRRVIEEYAEAVADARGQTQRLAGTLLVSAPVGLGELRLNALFLEFLTHHPEIEMEVILNDRMIELVEEGVDIAIRLGNHLPPNVIARSIASSSRVLVATPKYLKGAAKLRRPEDVAKHEYLRYPGLASGSEMEWFNGREKVVVPIRGRYRINSSLALRECLLQGRALGTAPGWLVQDLIDSGALIRLLPRWQMASQPLHLVYPSRRYQPLRSRALLQFLVERIPRLPGFRGIGDDAA